MSGRVVVVGSVNVDRVLSVRTLPAPGETVLADRVATAYGGKGANQAVAAARLGARVLMVGAVGEDDAGYGSHLERQGVETALRTVDGPTGEAVVVVDAQGGNQIVVHPGANALVPPTHVREALADLGPGDVVLTQLETDPALLVDADLRGARLVVNPAPAVRSDAVDALLNRADVVVPNEGELRTLTGSAGLDGARRLLRREGQVVVVTLGAQGARWVRGDEEGVVDAPTVTARDTTGAGDAFCGALGTALAGGEDVETAVRLAVEAASWSVRRHGTHDSYPGPADLRAGRR